MAVSVPIFQRYCIWLIGRKFQLHDLLVVWNPLFIIVRLLAGGAAL